MRTDSKTAHAPPGFDALVDLVRGRRVVALTGAGCSTESGIPDYRGPRGRLRERAPIQYDEFVRSSEARRRYWARSAVGWPRLREARPNPAHRALATLERSGFLRGIITQNVDRLHQKAGSRTLLELHGSLEGVRCLACDAAVTRTELQDRLLRLNPSWGSRVRYSHRRGSDRADTAPDGDAELPSADVAGFRVPPCRCCAGVLKPDVVFFGENVPPARVERAWRLDGKAELILVVGSSLSVFSGRRFVYRAREDSVPIAIVNIGPTRADELARIKIEGRAGEVLPDLAASLLSRGTTR